MDLKDMGERVRNVRRSQGLTQEELAEKAGLSASFLGHIERGSRVASLDTLISLCNTLEVSPDYLLSASLHTFDSKLPGGLNEKDRAKLSEFLKLAQETVRGWND